jgi:oxygen-independent coproporphyrinogen-3 oxidase
MSLGVQTLEEALLRSVNRRHDARQAFDACDLLVGSGLSVNVDLIYGFPGQSEDNLCRDIEAFAARGTHSFTVYSLRLNEHTPLARVAEDMQHLDLAVLMGWRQMIERVMSDVGFEQFRWHMFRRCDLPESGHDRAPGIDAFGVGREVGIGASAYSHLGETIYRNYSAFQDYVRSVEAGESPVEDVFPFAPHDRRTLFVARTLGDGRTLCLNDYEQTFGRRFDEDFGSVLNPLLDAGLVQENEGQLALTEVGRLVYDLVTLAFYPEVARRWLDEQQPGLERRQRAQAPANL